MSELEEEHLMTKILWPAILFLALNAGVACAAEKTAIPTLDVEVDARNLHRRLLHARITLPCRPGKLKLWYPKWVPGTHAKQGPLENIGGLRVETPDGKAVTWQRDEVDLYAIICDVPAGASAVRARLDYICNQGSHAIGAHSYGNSSVGVINWNTCLLYPDGFDRQEVQVRLQLRLPKPWRFRTALDVDKEEPGLVTFKAASLYDVIDSPAIMGTNVRSITLPDTSPPAYMHLASESPGALQLGQDVIDKYTRLVQEAHALFGAAHYPRYHFLVTCSDELGYFGLEHHSSCLNGVKERDLIDAGRRRGWIANLLPHEYAHSWCGKYRRPRGMCTPDYHSPERTRLLWIYEGLTMYLGDVLMVRCGLAGEQEYRETLAHTIGTLMRQHGRRWRSLEDTAVASAILRASSPNWNELRRGQDYYQEGLLVWLEADTIIREVSGGKCSLDDFCKRFMGPRKTRAQVEPYDLAEVIQILRELADYDWERFFQRRVSTPQESLPLDVVTKLGYRIHYASAPSGFVAYLQTWNNAVLAEDSLGLNFSSAGKITTVIPGMAGDKAGLVPGTMVQGVNGLKFSAAHLNDALVQSTTTRKVDLLILEGERYRTVALSYADGPRYLELTPREAKTPDVLHQIMMPRVAK
jgi:predicted metalloprotease with PDZ domain